MVSAPTEKGKVLTMAEYVTKEQVIDWYRPYGQTDEPIPFETLVSDLRDMKAADVDPVRHEQWIEPSRLHYGAKQYECSLCYLDAFWKKHSITVKYPYCPNCGAKMDLED